MSLPANYPASLDSLANPTATTNRDDPGFELDLVIARIQDIVEALEAKVGIGASLPAANTVLRGTGAGTSAFGQLQAGDLAAGAAPARLATQTLGAPAASITLSSIPSTYAHLQLRIYGRATLAAVAESIYVQFNGDTTASYHSQGMVAFGATAQGAEALQAAANGIIGFVPGASSTVAGWFAAMTCEIPNYASSATGFKMLTCVSHFAHNITTGSIQTRVHGVTWFPVTSAAITTILLKPTASSWQTGTVVSLYGFN